jgi:hypothetical protein
VAAKGLGIEPHSRGHPRGGCLQILLRVFLELEGDPQHCHGEKRLYGRRIGTTVSDHFGRRSW